MMCGAIRQQHLALGQRLAHQAELVVLEIAQAAMDQLGRGRGRAAGKIALLAQEHRQAAAGGIAGDAAAVDAAADDGDVVDRCEHADFPRAVQNSRRENASIGGGMRSRPEAEDESRWDGSRHTGTRMATVKAI